MLFLSRVNFFRAVSSIWNSRVGDVLLVCVLSSRSHVDMDIEIYTFVDGYIKCELKWAFKDRGVWVT